jgi:hypothetical protein
VNRLLLAGAFLIGMAIAGGVLYVVTARPGFPDETSETPAVASKPDLPVKPDSPSSRDTSKPAPRAPAAPRAPTPEVPRDDPPAPETATATLRVASDVAGAQVFLNREFVGAAPVRADDLKPGSYQLNVSAPGYDNHVETIELAPGVHDVSVRFREVRLNASVDVIHKHRFGSCRGTLIATPQGLRYETTEQDDVFETALLNLDAFQIDYREKNLRIQPRKGKRYDFTDPEGNADRLFVFHRDVERARDRLKKGDTP